MWSGISSICVVILHLSLLDLCIEIIFVLFMYKLCKKCLMFLKTSPLNLMQFITDL